MSHLQPHLFVAEEIWKLHAQLATILALQKCGEFDSEFYKTTYPEFYETGLSAEEHYVLHGAQTGKKPAWWFDSELYLNTYPDVANDGINPFWHYIRYGRDECRKIYFIRKDDAIKFAEEAMQNRNFKEAILRWSVIREQFPEYHYSYARASYACMELLDWEQAEALCREAMQIAPKAVESYIAHVDAAMRQRHFEEVLDRCGVLREQFPTYHHGYTHACYACMELKNWVQAESFSKEGMEKFSNAIEPHIAHVDAAMRQRHFEEALDRCGVLREQFSTYHHGYTRASYAYMELFDWEQAEALCREAMQIASKAVESYIANVDVATRQRHFEEALTRCAVLREQFPTYHHGYTNASYACMELKNWVQAESFSKEGMEKFPNAIEPHIAHVDAAMRQRHFEEVLDRCVVLRDKFPNYHHGYTRASAACLELADWVQAEAFSKEGVEKLPNAIEPYIAYVDAAMRQRHFEKALARCAVLRERFSTYHHGYTHASYACMELKNWAQAESFSKEGMEKFPNAIEPHIAHVDAAMRQRHFEEALDRCGVLRNKFPNYHHGYTRASAACLELADWVQAEAFSKESVGKLPNAIESYIAYVDVAMRQRHFEDALDRCVVLREKFSNYHHGYTYASAACKELADWVQAEAYAQLAIEHAPNAINSFLNYANLSIMRGNLEEALAHGREICERFPDYYYGYTLAIRLGFEQNLFEYAEEFCKKRLQLFPASLGNTLEYAASIAAQPAKKRDSVKLYKNISNCFEYQENCYKPDKNRKNCFYSPGVGGLLFFSPVIKCLPPSEIDIVVNMKTDVEIQKIEDYGLEKYNFIFGIENLSQYLNVICDQWFLHYSNNVETYIQKSHNFISLSHGVDDSFRSLYKSNCAIFAHQRATLPSCENLIRNIDITQNCVDQFEHIPPYCKTEAAFSGPYHIGEYLHKRHLPKHILRSELEAALDTTLPVGRPVVAVFLDEISDMEQLAVGINKLSEHVSVIYKTILGLGQDLIVKSLSSDVIVWESTNYAPNTLRFGVDFILAGYYSGTFSSSVMLGLPVIPFYTQQLRNKTNYAQLIPNIININDYSSRRLLYYFKKIFDIIKTQEILDAIYNPFYTEWYYSNLNIFQKEAFGEYILEGAPEKTADHILNFVNNRTLGVNCSSMLLKEQYFNSSNLKYPK